LINVIQEDFMHTLGRLTPQEPEKVEPMPEPRPEIVQALPIQALPVQVLPVQVLPSKRPLLKRIIDVLDGVPAARPKEAGKSPRGQSMIEMAFIIPVLIVLIAGIIEIGWYANNYINLLEAAKVGARRGPFLNDNNSPLLFDPASSVAPRVNSTITNTSGGSAYPALPGPLDPGFDAGNPRNRLRGIDGPNAVRCDGITNIQDYGFYNLVLCTVLESLDPLSIRFSDDYTSTEFKDDVVISVFSIQHVSNGPGGASNTDTVDPSDVYDFDINSRSSQDYSSGDQVIVVGRWPYNANECVSNGVNQEGRDPFDYIVNGVVDQGRIPTATGVTVPVPYELSVEVNDPLTGAFVDFAPFADAGNENQRGWAYTGQHIIDQVGGYTGNCYGSEFTLQEVQELVNLPRFIRDAPTPADEYDRRRYLPNQGLVLVEVFWEHTLLLGTFQSRLYEAYDLFSNLMPGGTGRVIHVWAAFPAPSAEPSILYTGVPVPLGTP
jgi:hypothetical protein